MKTINISNYDSSMGQLIDVEDNLSYGESHIKGSINIPYQKLLYHYKEYLDKSKPYYLTCKKGVMARKVANILEFYGYNVTVLIK